MRWNWSVKILIKWIVNNRTIIDVLHGDTVRTLALDLQSTQVIINLV